MREQGTSVLLFVHLQPGARHSAVRGVHGTRLKIAVAAPPLEGRANEALVAWIAERLRVPRQRVRIAAGERSRDKTVQIEGISAAEAVRQLAA